MLIFYNVQTEKELADANLIIDQLNDRLEESEGHTSANVSLTLGGKILSLILRPLSILAQVGRFPHNLSLSPLPVLR